MELSNFEIDERGVLLIPANVSKLNQLSQECKIGVREIKMHDEVTSICEQFAINARLLNYVAFSNRMESIPPEAFFGCVRLACVDLPSRLSVIFARAFMDSGLEYLSFGKNLKQIGESAFLNCNLSKIEFNENSELRIVGKNAFAGNRRLKNVALPESVIEVGAGAFAGCVGMKNFVVGPNVVKMGNPFKSELFIHKGKMPLSIRIHLNSAQILISGLEPIKAKDFVGIELDEKLNLRIVYTTTEVLVEKLDRVRGTSEFERFSKVDFEKTKIKPTTDFSQDWLNDAIMHDYLKQGLGINVDTIDFHTNLASITRSKSKFVKLNFTCTKLIDVSELKKFSMEHNNLLLDYLKSQPNLDAVAVRTHQVNWQKLYLKLTNEQKHVHATALGLLEFKEKILMATFGDSFENIEKDKVSAEQLNFLVKEGTRILESKWIEADADGELKNFVTELNAENDRLCKALKMQEYIKKLNIDSESFYQLADILVQNPNQWEEYLNSDEDLAVVGFVKALEHEFNWHYCLEHMSRKMRELYFHYVDDLLPAELHRTKVKITRAEYDEFIKNGTHNFESLVLKTNEESRLSFMQKYVSNMEKAHTFALMCKHDAERQFKATHKRPKERDEIKKWEQDLLHAGEDAYYAKYNEVMQKVENDKIDYKAILQVCKVNFKNKPVAKNLLEVQKLKGKISIFKFKSMHIDRSLMTQFL